MTIPAPITIALASLQAQTIAAQPLANATNATIIALQLNAGNLVNSIQTALTTTTLQPNLILTTDSVLLDTWVAPPDPISMITGALNMLVSSQNQANLSLMRGVVGRAASNLDQLV